MYKIRKIIVSVVLLLIILSGCSSQVTTEDKVTGLVNNYLEALKAKDISAMVKYTDDIRFPDKKEQEKEYSRIDDNITETKIIEIEQVSNTEYNATVEIVSDGNSNELTFPVRKQEKGWKIIVGQDF